MFSKLDQGFFSHQPSFFLLNSSVSAPWWLLGNLDSGSSSLCFLSPVFTCLNSATCDYRHHGSPSWRNGKTGRLRKQVQSQLPVPPKALSGQRSAPYLLSCRGSSWYPLLRFSHDRNILSVSRHCAA